MPGPITSRRERGTTAKGAKQPQQQAQRSKPSEDDIRILAYRLYELRRANGASGDAASDWIEAERLLADELAELNRPLS
jgi:hypothetical protein